MLSHRNARSVAAVCAVLATCLIGNAPAAESAAKAAAPPAIVAAHAANAPERNRAREQEAVITAERAKAAAVPEPTGLLMSCLLGGVLLAIGQQLRPNRRPLHRPLNG